MAGTFRTYLDRMLRPIVLFLLITVFLPDLGAQLFDPASGFTRSDTLRGSIGPDRAWWDANTYAVTVRPDIASRSITGMTTITFTALKTGQRMQIDLQQPLVVDSIVAEISTFWETGGGSFGTPRLEFEREGNVVWVQLPEPVKAGTQMPIHIHYHGVPREAKNPPWDGGWIWRKDGKGNPWMSVACQGLGASVWYPCKDHQSDEPESAVLHIVVPDSLVGVGNGRFQGNTPNGDGTTTWHWIVSSPINSYNLVPYIGTYVLFRETYEGLTGPLDLDYWVLAHNEAKAREQFKQVPQMMDCFEQWFGPYPFYADGYKLVESPHLGMEHQSAIAYGNNYVNGYRGTDLSGTGHGMEWDYIIIHESGHEWFGNSITTSDIADMWIHEGFTDYSETIFTECQQGAEAAENYVIGLRDNIRNDKPIIGTYGVNAEGSGDMYYKGANLVHMIRHIVGDSTFKAMLLEMNRRYHHQVVSSTQVEAFLIGFDARSRERLHPSLFDQYLRGVQVPVLEHAVKNKQLWLRWTNAVDGLQLPVEITVNGRTILHHCTTEWTALPMPVRKRSVVELDRAWYVDQQRVPRSRVRMPGERPRNSVELSF